LNFCPLLSMKLLSTPEDTHPDKDGYLSVIAIFLLYFLYPGNFFLLILIWYLNNEFVRSNLILLKTKKLHGLNV